MQCIKEFIFLKLCVRNHGHFKTFQLFFVSFFIFLFSYLSVSTEMCFHFSIPTPWRVSKNLIGERGLKC